MNKFYTLMAALSLLLSVCTVYAPPAAPSDFVYVAEELPDAILEIRYYSTYNSWVIGSMAMNSRPRCFESGQRCFQSAGLLSESI